MTSRGRVSRPKRPRNYPEACWRKVPFDYSIDPVYLRWISGKGVRSLGPVAQPLTPSSHGGLGDDSKCDMSIGQ